MIKALNKFYYIIDLFIYTNIITFYSFYNLGKFKKHYIHFYHVEKL